MLAERDGLAAAAPDRGVDRSRGGATIGAPNQPLRAMNTPPPHPSEPPHRRMADDAQVRSWLKLRQELAELNARLEYLRLIVSLGVRRIV